MFLRAARTLYKLHVNKPTGALYTRKCGRCSVYGRLLKRLLYVRVTLWPVRVEREGRREEEAEGKGAPGKLSRSVNQYRVVRVRAPCAIDLNFESRASSKNRGKMGTDGFRDCYGDLCGPDEINCPLW